MVNKSKRKYYKPKKSLKLKNSGKTKVSKNRKAKSNKTKKQIKKKIQLKGGALGGSVCAPIIHNGDFRKNPNAKTVSKRAVDSDSCITPTALNKLVQAWNKDVVDNNYKINTAQSENNIYKDFVKIFQQSNSRLLPEYEWWDQPWVIKHISQKEIDEIKKEHYAPEAPDSWHSNPTEWLSTVDIEEKLKQYEDKYPEFKFYGATPIDFDLKTDTGACLVNSLCSFNLKSLLEQKTPIKYIGVVFNLDKHYESGSHWIAMYVNIPKREINYWDSYGIKPPKEVMDLMLKIQKQGLLQSPKINFNIQINKIRHQYKHSECGVYSCNFIIQQLEGCSFNDVCNNIINDDKMNARRKSFYN